MRPLKSLQSLIESFEKLPGVGSKSAERMAHAVLELPLADVEQFQSSLIAVKNTIHPCQECGILTESQRCEICDSSRPYHTLIVVSYAKDVFAFERLENPDYRYHVLGGVLSASKGLGVQDLTIKALQNRLKNHPFQEIILATNPTLEGETTAQYLATVLAQPNLSITRLGYGMPMGGHVDYADALTLSKALTGRTKVKGE